MSEISAVIPCYNAAPYLGEAIESVLRQTRPAREIVVVDDGSTDRSGAVARRYPVRYVRLPTNSGNAVARNRCIQEASCELIAWLDADDYWEPNHLEIVAGLLERHPEAAAAFSTVRFVGALRGQLVPRFEAGQPRRVFWECFWRTPAGQMSAVTRREALLRIGGYDEQQRSANDYELWMRLSRTYPFVCTHEVTSNYRWHASQLSRNPADQYRNTYRARLRLRDAVRAEGNEALAREMEERMRWIWERDLAGRWEKREMDALRFTLGFAELVPDAPDRVRRYYARRAWIPELPLRAWDLGPLGSARKLAAKLTTRRGTLDAERSRPA
ncbi:MAG TPA: glycosyltransferase family A protein [Gemmatimonadales bacterium]|nr:glycosyltransferase family A protein [Gemmatimonadales bacterium]